MMGELARALKDARSRRSRGSPVSPGAARRPARARRRRARSAASIAKDVFEKMFDVGPDAPTRSSRAEGLAQIDDEAQIVGADRRRARRATPTRSRSTAAGKTTTFGFLVGQVMKATAGKANPEARERAAEARARDA